MIKLTTINISEQAYGIFKKEYDKTHKDIPTIFAEDCLQVYEIALII